VELRLLTDADFSKEYGIVENELIDQYVEDGLTADERAQFERYFLRAPERKDKLAFASALSQAVRAHAPVAAAAARKPSAVPWYYFRSFHWKAAAAVVIAVGVGLVIWVLLARRSEDESGMESLRAAYKNQRLIEARITSLDYAPLMITRGQGAPKIDEAALRRAELQLLNNVNARPGAKAHHDLGRFYLAGAQFDKAAGEFEKALAQAPDDPQVESDLGAALLAEGQQAAQNNDPGKAFTLLASSLQHVEKALQARPDLLEALYNRALCLQYMKLPEQAKEAWQNYLAHDSQSRWAEEARRNLQSLSEEGYSPPTAPQLLESFLAAFREQDDARAWQIMSRNREIITGKMIPPQLARNFISAATSGKEESARESLRALLFAGELDRQRGGDPYTSELAGYYAQTSPAQRRLLAEAIGNLYEGYELCLGTQYGAAARRFESARALFGEAGDAWEAELAGYWVGYCLTQLDRVAESNALLKTVAEYCESRSYKWLLAQTYGWLAVNYSISSEHSNSIKYYQQSLALAEAVSDTYQMQKMLVGLGSEYEDLRQPQLSLDYFYRGLSLAFQGGTPPRQLWRNYSYATSALFTSRHYDAAAAVANEALRLGLRELNDPSLIYLLHLNLGQIYSKLRRFDEALRQANLGLELARSTQDASAGRKFTAKAFLQQGHIWRDAGDYERADYYYNQAIALYSRMEFDLYRYAAYKGRLLCSLALNDEEGIRQNLPLLLQLSERYRHKIREEQNRNSFFDNEQSVYDIAIEYEHRKQNTLGAINYAEASRARSLLDTLKSGARVEVTPTGPDVVSSEVSRPLDLETIRQRIPAQVHVLMYAVLPTRLLIWSVSREGVAVFEKEISAEALEASVRQYVDSLKENVAASGKSSAELGAKLYELLVQPAEGSFGAGQKICIIPDKFLSYLPFAALISPTSGRYLVEDRAVFYAPSLNVMWRCSEEARRKAGTEQEAVLSIGNPTFDRSAYPTLQPLQAAEREATQVAQLYSRSTSLLGPEARKASVLKSMPLAEVVHYAGHYVIDESSPLLSRMLLANEPARNPGDTGSDLFAFEILAHRFDRTKLVVLSACQTGLDKYYNGEGAVGLSRTFIAAGVPLIVASQWAVESNGTANLMISFHRHRRSGAPTVDALREAQVEMLHGTDETYRSPYYWAAFLCIGGLS
jgi:CHAT domain-containing protein